MVTGLRPIVLPTLLLVAAHFPIAAASAAPQRYRLETPSGFRVATGSALVMSSRGLDQFPVEMQRSGDGDAVATILLDTDTLPAEAAVSSMLISESGDVYFSPIEGAHTLADMDKLPPCPAERDANLDFSGQHALLESLVRLRTQYRDGFRSMMGNRLTAGLIEDLSKLEELFGLSYTEPMSADMALPQLVDRLARLTEAVQNYKAHKARLAAR